MQEGRAGSSRDSRRPVQRPSQSQANPTNTTAHARPSTSTGGINYDHGQYAASTPQATSTSSTTHTPVGNRAASDHIAAPPPHIQPAEQMSIGQPQPANPSPLDYGNYNYAPGGALIWDFDTNLEVPDFTRFYEPQGELVQEAREHQQAAGDFSLPEPVSRQESEAFEATQSAAHQQPLGGVVRTPVSMPVVLGGVSAQQQPGPFAPPARQASSRSSQSEASLKRKSETEPTALLATSDEAGPSTKRPARVRTGSTVQDAAGTSSRNPMATRSQSAVNAAQPALTIQTSHDNVAAENLSSAPGSAQPPNTEAGNKSPTAERTSGPGKARKVPEGPAKFSNILPAGKVFPIQIGSELFRLSGASISSDGASNFIQFAIVEIDEDTYRRAAPSYFSHFFSEQLLNNTGKSGTIRTLYIDRDPQTFKDISLHLQGYHVKPRDGEHYVRLFADAQFYSLPRLTQQLFKTDIYIQIGDRNFQIPRDIFSAPGNSPNFFSLGFAHFFSTPSEVFPGLDRTSLLRPPSIQPPSVPNRSADVFQDILHLLQGYPVNIRDEGHRQDLLRDARYFHLKGLEQKLIPCNVSFNLARQRSEIVVRLEDIRQSGVSFQPDPDTEDQPPDPGGGSSAQPAASSSKAPTPARALTPAAAASGFTTVPTGYICYARPFTDETAHSLIVETSSTEATRIDLAAMRAAFADQTKARIASLFQVIANKMNLPATQPLGLMMVERGGGIAAMPVSPSNSGVSGDRVRVSIDKTSWCEVNGGVVEWDEDVEMGEEDADERPRLPRVRRWRPSGASEDKALDPLGEWVVSKAHWRLKVQPSEDDARIVEVVMQVVKLQAWVGERNRNGTRAFLI